MTEKEKKAIEKIERQILIGECEKAIGVPIYIYDLKIILNLINKNKKLEEYADKLLSQNEWYKDYHDCDSIPKSKVQEKIKELEEQYKNYEKRWEEAGMNKAHPFYKYLIRIEAEIDILQELLK